MRRILTSLAVVVIALAMSTTLAGCGDDKDKNKNKGTDGDKTTVTTPAADVYTLADGTYDFESCSVAQAASGFSAMTIVIADDTFTCAQMHITAESVSVNETNGTLTIGGTTTPSAGTGNTASFKSINGKIELTFTNAQGTMKIVFKKQA